MTDINILEMRWQWVSDIAWYDMETVSIITHNPSWWHNHVIVISRAQPKMEGNGNNQFADITEIRWQSVMNTVICNHDFEDDALRQVSQW